MPTYRIEFDGKEKGAIGSFSHYCETVTAETFEAAVLHLYDRYEHVLGPRDVPDYRQIMLDRMNA